MELPREALPSRNGSVSKSEDIGRPLGALGGREHGKADEN